MNEARDGTEGRRLRWGVISTANIGRAAVNPAIQASSNGSLVAVASRDGERAGAFAREHGSPESYGSYEALLERDAQDREVLVALLSAHTNLAVTASRTGSRPLAPSSQ